MVESSSLGPKAYRAVGRQVNATAGLLPTGMAAHCAVGIKLELTNGGMNVVPRK
jgi:hypothetical protein